MADDFDNEASASVRIQKEADELLGGFGEHLASSTISRRFSAFFGTTIHITYTLWCLLAVEVDGPVGGTIAHLLWTLLFLKMYGTVDTMSRICKVDPVTHRKWTWLFLERIADLHYSVVSCVIDDMQLQLLYKVLLIPFSVV